MAFEYEFIFKYMNYIATVIIVLIVLITSIVSTRKRKKNMKELAMRIGFYYDESKKPEIPNTTLPLLLTGTQKKISNLMRGRKSGYEWNIFDFTYSGKYGNSRSARTQTVFMVKLKNKVLPEFSITPENFAHKLGNIFGSKDIDFEKNPAFSDKYHLKGNFEEGIKNMFDQKIIHFFDNKNIDYTIEAATNHMIFYIQNKKTKPDNIIISIDKYAEVVRLFDKI